MRPLCGTASRLPSGEAGRLTVRYLRRTSSARAREDGLDHSFEIGVDLGIPEPADAEAHRREYGVAPSVAHGASVPAVLAAIELDHDPLLEACEVDHEGTDGNLPSEMQVRGAKQPELTPQLPLLRGRARAKVARHGERNGSRWPPSRPRDLPHHLHEHSSRLAARC
jgi:hypothetical protein